MNEKMCRNAAEAFRANAAGIILFAVSDELP
jgi:hypothetical protein